MSELLPCPFCGASVEIKEERKTDGYPSTSNYGGFIATGSHSIYKLLCGTDGCFAGSVCISYRNKETLINEWNTRAE